MLDIDRLLETTPANDPRVSEALMNAYFGYITRLCYSILGDRDEADDAAQETFIHALIHLPGYRPGAHFKSWLSTIAVNQCRDMLRRRKTRQTLAGVLRVVERITDRSWTPVARPIEDAADRQESRDALWRAVQALDEKHRLPVVLRLVHGLPVAEIAQVLGLNEGTVHSRLHYAVRKLKDSLGQEKPAGLDTWDGPDGKPAP